MAKPLCTPEEFEKLEAIRNEFSFFCYPQLEESPSEYDRRQTELIENMRDPWFWPTFERLCKKSDTSLAIVGEGRFIIPDRTNMINYCRALSGRTDFIKRKPIPDRLPLDLDMLVRAVDTATKSGEPVEGMDLRTMHGQWKAERLEAWACQRSLRGQVKRTFDRLLRHLTKSFGEKIKPKVEDKQVEPLSKKARLIYEHLKSFEKHEAKTLPEIQDWLYGTHEINLDEGTWREIRKELLPYGLKNKRRIGYYFRK